MVEDIRRAAGAFAYTGPTTAGGSPGERRGVREARVRRREIIRFLATAAAGFCGKRILPAAPVAPVFQDARAVEPLLPLFPLPLVLFPEIDLALHIFEERYKQMIRECLLQRREFGIVLMRGRGFETAGCTAAITEILRSYRNGELDILVQGRRRFELGKLNRDKPYLRGEATFFEDDVTEPPPESLRRHAIEHYDRLVALLQADEPSLRPPALSLEERMLSFRIITAIPADHQTRQRLLTLRSERDRLVQILLHLQQLIDYLEKGPAGLAPKSRA